MYRLVLQTFTSRSQRPFSTVQQDCEFSLPRPSVVRVTAFSAQDGDSLTINHEAYTGDDLEGGLVVWIGECSTKIAWL